MLEGFGGTSATARGAPAEASANTGDGRQPRHKRADSQRRAADPVSARGASERERIRHRHR
jgi:hypothetical protein